MSASNPVRGRKPLIPVTVVTGFLGAGKSTLINRLTKDPALAGSGFIVNEFGEIGIDHLLVGSGDEGIVELSSGCLCCTMRGALVTTLENFLRGVDNGRIETLNRIVIETTGLADPAPVLMTVIAHPYLSLRYAIDGVVTVVDAAVGEATLDAHEEAVKQVAVADRLVLTKTDIADPAATGRLLRRLTALNPAAPILRATDGEATSARLLDCGYYDPATKAPDVVRWLKAEAYEVVEEAGHEHDDEEGAGHVCSGPTCDHPSHHHDPHGGHAHAHAGHSHEAGHHEAGRHEAGIRSFALATDDPLPIAALETFLELLSAAHGPDVLRIKGVVRLAEDPERPLVVQGVQSVFHPPVRLERWPDADRRTRLVFITRNLPEETVRRMFDGFAGVLAPDTPDRAAVLDNPLTLVGFTPPSRR